MIAVPHHPRRGPAARVARPAPARRPPSLRAPAAPSFPLVVLAATALSLAAAFVPVRAQQEVDAGAGPDLFGAFTPRVIGPAGTSGRTTAVDAVDADPDRIWVGTATGGVWRSDDGGATWTPVFDHQPASSIGAVAIRQDAPDVVWVGTGEGNPRNSAGVGRGIFRTRDGGRTWEHLGLERSERIHRILLHPTDPDVVWVAALGPAWSDGEERGVFRTDDGGRTWERVLWANPSTGASALVMDPSNPDHLLAALYDFRRWPWFYRSGGPGSGIHESWDGGRTWRRLTAADGLPEGELGRIGLAWAVRDPEVVYALVEAKKTALLRSSDGGRTWATVNDRPGVSPRPFYFSDLAVDPTNENRVYRVSGSLDVSDDGGKTFRTITPWSSVHPDHHDLWVSPDGRMLVDVNDGGTFISRSRGRTWRFVDNIPVAQFYHIDVDMAVPFNVYGGLQDNGSWLGPSQVWESPSFRGSTVMSHHWRSIGFGDGMRAVLLGTDPDHGFSQYQGGMITRFDRVTGEWKDVRPAAPDTATELRFNWNAGIALDPFDSTTVYYGSQFVHRTRDGGRTWDIISPDLTTNDPEKQRQRESGGLTIDNTTAENHTTIITIAPSPVERGVIWVGTDDGNVQITRDDGATWTNVVERIDGVPEHTWVPHIEASKHDAGTAWVVFDDHRRGNWTPYVYRTTDYGRSWTSLVTPELDGFAHVVEEDPVEPRLLFLGTEFGLWVSLDGGGSWRKWKGFPTVPVRSLVVHPRDHDLVVGTHGRAAWIIDDVRPLRALAADPALAGAALHAFDPPPAIQHPSQTVGPLYFPGDARFHGTNRPYGALISFMAAAGAGDTAAVTVFTSAGDSIRYLSVPARKGLNRAVWDLRRDGYRALVPDDVPEAFRPRGPEVVPGAYTVRIALNGDTARTTVRVLPDPRRDVPESERVAKWEAMERAGGALERVTDAVRKLEKERGALDFLRERAAEADAGSGELTAQVDSARARLTRALDALRQPPGVVGWVDDRSAATLLGQSLQELGSSYDAPTEAQRVKLERRLARTEAALAEAERWRREELAELRRALQAAGVSPWGAW